MVLSVLVRDFDLLFFESEHIYNNNDELLLAFCSVSRFGLGGD